MNLNSLYRFMQAFYSQLHGQPQATSHSGGKPTKVLGSAESKLNTTFTKDSETIPDVLYKTPVSGSGGTKGPPTSYEMTPAENDPLFAYDNYDIGNLSSEDSTDDEDCPKKVWINIMSLYVVSNLRCCSVFPTIFLECRHP